MKGTNILEYKKFINIVKYSSIACLLVLTFKAFANEKLYLAYHDHCPYTCIDKPQESLIINIITHVYKEQGIDVELVLMPSLRAVKLISTGRVSGEQNSQAIHVIFVAKSDVQNLIFPNSAIIQDKQCFYTLKDSTWEYSPKSINKDIVLGIQSGSKFPEIEELTSHLKKKNRLTELSPSNSFEQLFEMLLKKRVGAIYDVSASIEFTAQKLNIMNMLKKGWCESNYIEGFIGFSPAYPKKAKRWQKIWDENYPKLLAQGVFDSIFNKYNLKKPLNNLQ